MSSAKIYLDRLRARGWRITAAREAMLEIFCGHHQPLSAVTITEAMVKRGCRPNKTTVYRELERLKSEGVIREVLIEGKARYFELSDEEGRHHHHLICSMCKRVEDFDPSSEIEEHIDALTALVQRKAKFGTLDHSVDFFGVCERCA